MILKATKRSYFGRLWELGFYIILLISLPFIFDTKVDDGTFEFMVKLAAMSFLFFCVPAIVLFYRYIVVNKNIEVNYRNNKIDVSINGKCNTFEINDIDHVHLKLTIPVYYNGFRFFATDSFLYAVIYFKSKGRLTITTLIDNELFDTKEYFRNKVKLERKLRFFCWPPKHKLTIN